MDLREASDDELAVFESLRGSRVPAGSFVGDGERVVRRMLAEGVARLVVGDPARLEKLKIPPGVEVRSAARARLEAIVGYRLHTGVMALGTIPPEKPLGGTLHVALDRLANAENVGSVMRSAAAFGVDGVIVGPGTSSPWMRRSVRVAIGAPLVVPVHFPADFAGTLRGMNAWAAHIHGERRDFRDVDARGPIVLVLGSEADGVSDDVLDACKGTTYIPMERGWDCLNVGTSAAVLLAEVQRQRRG